MVTDPSLRPLSPSFAFPSLAKSSLAVTGIVLPIDHVACRRDLSCPSPTLLPPIFLNFVRSNSTSRSISSKRTLRTRASLTGCFEAADSCTVSMLPLTTTPCTHHFCWLMDGTWSQGSSQAGKHNFARGSRSYLVWRLPSSTLRNQKQKVRAIAFASADWCHASNVVTCFLENSRA